MDLPLTLTLEQQFALKAHAATVKNLSAEQAQELLLEVISQLMVKDNIVKHLIKQKLNGEWGC